MAERACELGSDGCLRWSLPRSCEDAVACTLDRCSPDIGRCEHIPDDSACDMVGAGMCMRGRCDALAGCLLEGIDGPCDDGSTCTTGDSCQAGACTGRLDVMMDGCVDACPDDPRKHEPGRCGCGVLEKTADSDGDGTIDCMDECPFDACSEVGSIECRNGATRECVLTAEGCFSEMATGCDDEICWDADRCSGTISRGLEQVAGMARRVAAGSDGDFYLTGSANGDVFLARTAMGGGRDATQYIRSTNFGIGWGVAVAGNGDAVVTGGLSGSMLAALWPPNAPGNSEPKWTNGDVAGQAGVGRDVTFGLGGDVFVAGEVSNTGTGDIDAVVVRLERATGDRVWARRWGGTGRDEATGISSDGTDLYVAATESGHELLKVQRLRATDGEPVWIRTWGRETASDFRQPTIAARPDGTAVVLVMTNDGHLVTGLDAMGDTMWSKPGVGVWVGNVAVADDGTIFVAHVSGIQRLGSDGEPVGEFGASLGMNDVTVATTRIEGEPVIAVGGNANGPRIVWLSPK